MRLYNEVAKVIKDQGLPIRNGSCCAPRTDRWNEQRTRLINGISRELARAAPILFTLDILMQPVSDQVKRPYECFLLWLFIAVVKLAVRAFCSANCENCEFIRALVRSRSLAPSVANPRFEIVMISHAYLITELLWYSWTDDKICE